MSLKRYGGAPKELDLLLLRLVMVLVALLGQFTRSCHCGMMFKQDPDDGSALRRTSKRRRRASKQASVRSSSRVQVGSDFGDIFCSLSFLTFYR